jgi:hypothetical protein
MGQRVAPLDFALAKVYRDVDKVAKIAPVSALRKLKRGRDSRKPSLSAAKAVALMWEMGYYGCFFLNLLPEKRRFRGSHLILLQ